MSGRGDSQVLFLAMGYPYLVMAINAAQSVRRSGTKDHIKLITNHPVSRIRMHDVDVFDSIEALGRDADENRWVKTRIIDHAEGARNVFLDCDIEVKAALDPVLGLLDNFDIAARNLPVEKGYNFGDATDQMSLSYINTGVIFFRKSAGANELFDLWHRNFVQMGLARDQPAFLKALLESRTVRLFPLPPMWNASPVPTLDRRQMKKNPEAIRLLHYRDPSNWPSVAPRLAAVHKAAVVDLARPSSEFSAEANAFTPIARRFANPLYQNLMGRFCLAKALKLSARFSPGAERKLTKRMKRRAPLPRSTP